MYRINHLNQRIAILARQNYPVFHTKDLGKLWHINNSNTLYTVLKRYTQKKILFRIFKGLYSLYPLDQIDPLLLGLKAVHRFAYISTETILSQHGILPQILHHITLVSFKAQKFTLGKYSYVCRKLTDKYLFNSAGIIEENNIKKATIERAVADLLYFNPHVTIDGKKLIDMEKLHYIQHVVGYPLTPHFYKKLSA